MFWTVAALILIALFFDYVNGFHDAANSIATVVSTRVLTPGKAVIWAAFFNFVAAFTFGTAVATTIGAGMIDRQVVTLAVILGGLDRRDHLGPHHLVLRAADKLLARADRRLRGRGRRESGLYRHHSLRLDQDDPLHLPLAAHRTGCRLRAHDRRFSGCSAGCGQAASTTRSGGCSSCPPRSSASITAPTTRRKRWASSPASCSPRATSISSTCPFWVIISAHAAIALGTLAGGWRIIHTMGAKITKLQPVGGFAAETGAALSLLIATHFGVPVSTTHAITGSIVGVGATRRVQAVRWGVAGQIVWAWVLTIPCAFSIAAFTYFLLRVAGAQ